ncbi:MAG: type II secretion system F family protein [Negativicutes bacterium]
MLGLIITLTFLTMFIVSYIALKTYAPVEGAAEMRLRALDAITQSRTDLDEELSLPFSQRILSPLSGSVATRLARLTPRSIREMVGEKLAAAGGLQGMGANEFLLLILFLSVALPLITAMLAMIAGAPVHQTVGFSLYAFALGLYLPFFILNRKIKSRRRSMVRDLPDVLDMLTVSVEAGLGFDGALHKLSEKMKGALVEEFSRLLNEIRVGVPRRNALLAMAGRCNLEDVSVFTTSLVQADQLGVGIGNVLRVQSAAMREKRRQRAQAAAMKAPVKMLLPLVMFIFPTIFVILLGPAVIQLIASFGAK